MKRSVVALLLGLSLAGSTGSQAAEPRRVWIELPRAVQPELAPGGLPMAPPPTPEALARRRARGRPDVVERLERGPSAAALRALRQSGARIRFVSRWLSRASIEADPATVRALRRLFPDARLRPVRSWVRERVREQRIAEPLPRSKSTGLDYGPSLLQNAQIEVDVLHRMGFSGAGVRILVLDSGFLLSHIAFEDLRVLAEYDFVFGDSLTANEAVDVPDQHDHGTGVLGVLGGFAPGSLIGPAYGAEFLLAKTERIDTETRVEEDNFVAALEWGEALGADVVTASLGYLNFPDSPDSFTYTPAQLDGDTAVTTRAMDDAVALGMVALSAVGNAGGNGPSSLLTPSDGDSVLAIGSVRADSTVSFFSSRGPTADGRVKPDLMARGSLTTWAAADSTFNQAFGTSLATPLAAGAVALVLEAHPEWGPGEVLDALRTTATNAVAPDNDRGWGLIRARAAVFDVADPVVPLPFALISPPDSAVAVGGAMGFVWHASTDLQSSVLDYQVEIALDSQFQQVVARYGAASDTTRNVGFLPAGLFHWRVRATDPDGHQRSSLARVGFGPSSTTTPAALGPSWARLAAPYPNPFNPRVNVEFELDRTALVQADIHDLAGRKVRRLFATSMAPGVYRWTWEGQDDRLRPVGSGVYLLRVQARVGGAAIWRAHRRLVLLR